MQRPPMVAMYLLYSWRSSANTTLDRKGPLPAAAAAPKSRIWSSACQIRRDAALGPAVT